MITTYSVLGVLDYEAPIIRSSRGQRQDGARSTL